MNAMARYALGRTCRWLAAVVLLATLGPGLTQAQDPASQPPNILFILTDDQRWDALGAAGNDLIHTPNLDRLAARGVRFSNAFVTLSICSPSRAVCLTGQYGSSNGVTTLGLPIRKSCPLVPRLLKTAGYRTAVMGKWHLGNDPADCGFDRRVCFKSNGTWYDRPIEVDGQADVARGYVDDYLADESVKFIEETSASGQPFMLWLCTQVPHMDHTFDWPAREVFLAQYQPGQMHLPETWQDALSGKPPYLKTARSRTKALEYGYDRAENIRRHLQRYYAGVSQVDASLGRVLNVLDRLKLNDRTWVLQMGDNGWFLGEHGFTSKVLAYEESMRVPMLIAGPGVKAGCVPQLVLNADLAPTMLQVAGLEPPAEMHGTSLLPLLRGETQGWRTSFFYEAPTPALGTQPLFAIRTERWKYIRTMAPRDPEKLDFEELYDLQGDPHEMRNLAGEIEHEAQRKQLSDEMDRARAHYRKAAGRE